MNPKKTKTSAGMETPQETMDRAKKMLATPTPTTNGSDNASFSDAIEKRLLGQSNIVSSFDTQLEQSFTDAAAGLRAGNDASTKRIESVYQREKAGMEQSGQNAITGFSEGRSGFATQMAGLRAVVQSTDKNLNDLTQRKEELILQGDAQTASQISGLIIDKLKFKQQAEQQVFANLLGMANYGAQKEQSKAQLAQSAYQFGEKMKWDETTAMTSIALEYGLQANPGETLTTLYSRAAKDMGVDSPAALKIKQAQSEINRNNADILRIQNDIANANKKGKEPAVTDLDAIVNASLANPALMTGLIADLKPEQQAYVISKQSEKQSQLEVGFYRQQGLSKEEATAQIQSSDAPVQVKNSQIAQLETVYKTQPVAPDRRGTATKINDAAGDFAQWFAKNVFGEDIGN